MITSLQNEQVKQWKKLKRKKGREKAQAFLVEGFHLVEEAIKSNWIVRELIIREDIQPDSLPFQGQKTYVTKQVFSELADTEQPQGIIGVIEMKKPKWLKRERILITDAVQDPGNVGTLIRTADAAGFDGVVLGKGTVDQFNDKVIRSTQGSIFHIPVFQEELASFIEALKKDHFIIYASALENGEVYKKVPVRLPAALIVGNEGAGISETVLSKADEIFYIPIHGQAESLNVGIAAGILMYYLQD